jgi:RNA polymerase sigma-70 factor, ECF subfamily
MEPPVPSVRPLPSLSELYQEHGRGVIRTLRRLGIRHADLEDVAHEVFVVVHRKLPEFAGHSSLKTWLFGISLRVASGWRQRAFVQREVAFEEAPEVAISGEVAVRSIALKQARVELQELIEALDEDKREVFVLFELEQFSMPEIAETVGVPLQTAWSRLYAARKRIEEAIHQGHRRESA